MKLGGLPNLGGPFLSHYGTLFRFDSENGNTIKSTYKSACTTTNRNLLTFCRVGLMFTRFATM